MTEFITDHQSQLLWSIVILVLGLILKVAFSAAARKVGKLGEFNAVRTNLIVKYISIVLTLTAIAALTLVWGVDYKDLGVLLSSVFAVIGVALFAQWSILSNMTAGVIIFFSFPFKIGNTICILDKELMGAESKELDTFEIEDIRAFHLHLRKQNGEILTYPNNLILQKGVVLVSTNKEEILLENNGDI